MTTDKEELRKEYFKMLGMAAPIAERENPELFDWFYSKLEAKDKEIAEFKFQLNLAEIHITDLKAEIDSVARYAWDRACTEIELRCKKIQPDTGYNFSYEDGFHDAIQVITDMMPTYKKPEYQPK